MKIRTLKVNGKKCSVVACERYKKSEPDFSDPLCQRARDLKLGSYKEIIHCVNEILGKIRTYVPDIQQTKNDWLVANCPSIIDSCSARSIAEIIALALGIKRVSIKLMSWKMKIHYFGLTSPERKKLLREALYYRGPSLKGKNIILIDDIESTSSAIKGSAGLLLRKGAKKVDIFVYLKINRSPSNLEEKMSTVDRSRHSLRQIVGLLEKEKNIITSRLLFNIAKRSEKDKKLLLSRIRKSRKEEFIRLLKLYEPAQ